MPGPSRRGAMGGEAGLLVVCSGILVLEAWMLSASTPNMYAFSQSFASGYANTNSNQNPNASCGWNLYCYVLGSGSVAVGQIVAPVVMFLTAVTGPFALIAQLILPITVYSVLYPWLGLVNGLLIAYIVYAIVHGLI